MYALRRSHLARIALLCFAVLLSRTACAIKTVDQLLPSAPPSQSKVAAELPSSQKKLAVRVKKSLRPSRQTKQRSFFLNAAFGLHSPAAANLFAAAQSDCIVRVHRALGITSQFRPFALRI